MIRTYSLRNDQADNKRYSIAVKCELNGLRGSVKLHDEIKVGGTIGVSLILQNKC
jgi:vanillate O-demethylase ferredoxin subunit